LIGRPEGRPRPERVLKDAGAPPPSFRTDPQPRPGFSPCDHPLQHSNEPFGIVLAAERLLARNEGLDEHDENSEGTEDEDGNHSKTLIPLDAFARHGGARRLSPVYEESCILLRCRSGTFVRHSLAWRGPDRQTSTNVGREPSSPRQKGVQHPHEVLRRLDVRGVPGGELDHARVE